MNAGRIDEDDLRHVLRQNAQDAIARGLWFRRDNRNFLTQQGVEQGGLAHVRFADDGHKAGFETGRGC